MAGCPVDLFTVWRNEWFRAPAFLAHYGRLGIRHFFIVDNDSTTPPPAWLERRADVTIIRESGPFSESENGLRWLRGPLRDRARGRWVVICDADEHLVLPTPSGGGVGTFCDALDARGDEALYALLLDLYPLRDLSRDPATEDAADAVPRYFEIDTIIRDGVRAPPLAPTPVHCGGVRQRIFGTRVSLDKVPLLRYSDAVTLYAGMHGIGGARPSDAQAVVLHYKFEGAFRSRCETEAAREQHWQNAIEYKAYRDGLRRGAPVLHRAQSHRYAGPDQLRALGLLRPPGG